MEKNSFILFYYIDDIYIYNNVNIHLKWKGKMKKKTKDMYISLMTAYQRIY